MIRGVNWSGVLMGCAAIMIGVSSLFRTPAVASWLEKQGVRHSPDATKVLRHIRTLAVLFILAGVFFVYVAAILRH